MANKLKLTHPGKILREEFMAPAGMSAEQLARAMGVTQSRVDEILNEQAPISEDIAPSLSAAFGLLSETYWLNLQTHYDSEMSKE